MSAEFEGGETFTTTAPGKTVTDIRLNNHVNGATLLVGALTNKTELTATAENDFGLVADTSDVTATEPKKVQLVNLLPESVRNGSKLFGNAVLTGTVYGITLTPAPTSYITGMRVVLLPNATNTGAVQLELAGLSAVNIFKGGNTGPIPLVAADIVSGVACEVVFDGTQFQLVSGISLANQVDSISGAVASLAAIKAACRNLVVQTATTSTIQIQADEVLMKDSTFAPFVARGVSCVADLTASGVNGLDTGIETIGRWYYVYLIYNQTSNTVASLLSLSGTSPLLPSGYTYAALLGQGYNDGSGNLVTFYQQDRRVWINELVLFTGKTAAAANTYEIYDTGAGGSDLPLNTTIPPNAKSVRGVMGAIASGNSAIAIAANANGLGAQYAVVGFGVNMASYGAATNFEVPVVTAQTFYWKSNDNSTARNRVMISGYTF